MDDLMWIKASASNPKGNCVELAADGDGNVLIRDTKDPSSPPQRYTRAEFTAFLDGAQKGEFDHLTRI